MSTAKKKKKEEKTQQEKQPTPPNIDKVPAEKPSGLDWRALLSEIRPVAKLHKNQQQGYEYRSIDDIYNVLQPIFAKYGLVCAVEVVDCKIQTHQGERKPFFSAQITVLYTLMQAGQNGLLRPVLCARIAGFAVDYSDKVVNKALANAHKYFLIQTFLLPTGEPDPDADYIEPPLQQPAATAPAKPKGVTQFNPFHTVVKIGDKPPQTPLDKLSDDELLQYFEYCKNAAQRADSGTEKRQKASEAVKACFSEASKRGKAVYDKMVELL